MPSPLRSCPRLVNNLLWAVTAVRGGNNGVPAEKSKVVGQEEKPSSLYPDGHITGPV